MAKIDATRPNIDQLQFREAMSRIAAAVHVITSDGAAGRAGFTASAVCSVSDTPPTLLVCMNGASRQNPILRENGVLCVNTLCPQSRQLGDLFSGQRGIAHDERFDHAEWVAGLTGSPVLKGAAMSLEGRISDIARVGSHDVFYVEVQAIHGMAQRDALLYFGRSYRALARTAA
ncbi:flavin reductase [Frigidibacter sp. MR17.24]|uniref:flavin reductase n=1 Tax=Frigidibacter sp. MR17.24 TaxID=3127345 RepID=UPI003012F0B8